MPDRDGGAAGIALRIVEDKGAGAGLGEQAGGGAILNDAVNREGGGGGVIDLPWASGCCRA